MATFDECSIVVDKLSAARQLLDSAIEHLEAGGYLEAIVLGGSAEDVLEGLMRQQGKRHAASRQQLVAAMTKVFRHLFPGEHAPSEREAVDFMREAFNWLRHADRDESQRRRLNLKAEAIALCTRAIDNLWSLTGEEHPSSGRLGYPVGNPNV